MIRTDGRPTAAHYPTDSPSARHRPAHGGYPGDVPAPADTVETIDITPDWNGVRAHCLRVAACGPADLKHALRMAVAMGEEAPSLEAIAEACGALED